MVWGDIAVAIKQFRCVQTFLLKALLAYGNEAVANLVDILKKNLNASSLNLYDSVHPPNQGGECPNV